MSFKKIVGGCLFILFTSCSSAKFSIFTRSFFTSIRKQTLVLEDSTQTLYYQWNLQHKDTNILVFIVGGSGHSSMLYTLVNYSKELKLLSPQVYALQKRYVLHRETGMKKPHPLFLKNYYYSQMVKDQVYFIKKIIHQPHNLHKKIMLLGISEGGTIAAEVAHQISQINLLVMIGSGGMPQADELKCLYPNQSANLDSLYADIKRNPHSIDQMAMGYTYRYWAEILFIEPAPIFLQLNIPIVVGMGENDQNVPVQSGRYLKTIFEKNQKNNLQYLEYKNAGHTLLEGHKRTNRFHFFTTIQHLLQPLTHQ
jgi:pimeloyl-ACP methyl ester carboxylesterase